MLLESEFLSSISVHNTGITAISGQVGVEIRRVLAQQC